MKYSYLIRLLTALVLGLTATALYADKDASHREQVDTLFRLTQMEKRIQQSVDSVLQLQFRQNPTLLKHEKEMAQFFDKYIGWQALKEDIADMYMQSFSEDELKAINAFYITPAGQKVINVIPELVQQRNQLAMQRLQNNIGELQKIIAGSNTPH